MRNPFEVGYYTEDDLRDCGFAHIGENVRIAKNCVIVGLPRIWLGNDIRIDSCSVLTAPVGGYIRIAGYTHIGTKSFIGGGGGVTFEEFAGTGHGTDIFTSSDDLSGEALVGPTIPTEFTNVKTAPVRLGRCVNIASSCVILPGVEIGEGSTVGAMSLVSRSLAPWGIYFGIPVRQVGVRSKKMLELEQEMKDRLHKADRG